MKFDNHMDYLMYRVHTMNDLGDLRPEEREEEAGAAQKKKKTDGFFGSAMSEMFFRREGATRPRIVGITHPSDGHPQEELTPDFGWFRALSYNNPTWTLFWPELII